MNTIREKAMLASLTVRVWGGKKHDRDITEEVARTHGAKGDVGRYTKFLIDREKLKAVQSVANEIRNTFWSNTLPWDDNGTRLLTNDNYLVCMEKIGALKSKFEDAVTEFKDIYPSLIEDAKKKLNGMFKETDYPRLSDIAAKFGIDVELVPLPDTADLRIGLSEDEVARIKADIERRTEERLEEGMKDLWSRLHDRISHVAEVLGNRDAVIRDSLIENLVEICDLAPNINVAGDKELNRLCAKIKTEVGAYSGKRLRSSNRLRSAVTESARINVGEVERAMK